MSDATLNIDLHTHILPGLDDGPKTLEESLALARAAVAAGTGTLVATPHIDWRWSVEPLQVKEAVAALSLELDRAGIPLALRVGGEIAVSRLPELTQDQLAAVALGGGPYLLVECPHVFEDAGLEAAVFRLRTRGYKVVLAHPERCPAIQRDLDVLRKMVDDDAVTSVTAGSVAGRFGRTVRNFTFKLFQEGLAYSIASDAHDDRRRPPTIEAELQAAGSRLPGADDRFRWLTHDVPEAILSGNELPTRPAPEHGRRPKLWRMAGKRSRY